MKNVALLQYTFIFDPSETWVRASDFEHTLERVLGAMGLEPQAAGGQPAQRTLYIAKKPSSFNPPPPQAILTAKEQFNKIQGK